MEKIDSNGSDPLDTFILRFAKNAATRYGKHHNSNGYPVGNLNISSDSEPQREAIV